MTLEEKAKFIEESKEKNYLISACQKAFVEGSSNGD